MFGPPGRPLFNLPGADADCAFSSAFAVDRLGGAAQLLSLGVARHFMKTRYILLGLFAIATTVFARFPSAPYDRTKPPPSLPLPAAYQMAITALGQATNQFHCVSAELSSPGWKFSFFSTNASVLPKCFYVEFEGKVYEDDAYVPQ